MQLAKPVVVTAVLALVLVPGALASHQFTDIPDIHPFHAEIGVFKDTNITTGCTATTFCPSDYVRRQAMAAFVDRALGLVVRPGESTQKGVAGSRVSMIDDDLSFVGTEGNALRYRGPSFNVAGGHINNLINGGVFGATIAGGGSVSAPNYVYDDFGTVSGGLYNRAGSSNGITEDSSDAAVGGGYGNVASGEESTVPGGYLNEAFGAGSFAAGRNAHASTGSFHFGDGNWSGGAATYSPAENSFSAHATGGVHFHTNASGATTGCWIFPGGGSWSCSSDRNVKENFRPVDGKALLERVAKLPISSWNYKGQKDRFRHIGPMSQDFKAAFSVGEDDKSIAMVDADGIALAAIGALNAKLERKNSQLARQNSAQSDRIAAQSDRIAALERSVATLIRKEDR